MKLSGQVRKSIVSTVALTLIFVAFGTSVFAQDPVPLGPGGIQCPENDLFIEAEQLNGPFAGSQAGPSSPRAGLDRFFASEATTRRWGSGEFRQVDDTPPDHPEYVHLVYERDGTRLASAYIEPIDGGWLLHDFAVCSSVLRRGGP
jgi:hypothetical protein